MRLSNILSQLLPITLCCLMMSAQTAQALNADKNINYANNSGLHRQTLDIYTPAPNDSTDNNDSANSSPSLYPVHIFVHGGGWVGGDKQSVNERLAKRYTDQNIIMVSMNYRLGPDYKFPANIQDLATASKWLRENISAYGGDPDNMVISGHSAGAHLVALLGTAPKYLETHALSPRMFKSMYIIDTATFDLTKSSLGKAKRMVDFMKSRAFGNDPAIREAASPILQISSNQDYSPLQTYVTGQRAEAVVEAHEFTNKLKAAGYEANVTVMKDSLSHSDMKKQIFTAGSPIYKHITNTLNMPH